MKLTVTQENLSSALSTVSRVASTRSSLPILSNVLLKTKQNQLIVTATNLDIAVTETIGAKIDQKGSITVPARLMQDFIGSLPSGNLELEVAENKLTITADRFNSTINGMSADEFPSMPVIDKGTTMEFTASEIRQTLQQVLFTAPTNDGRPVLTGVNIHSDTDKMYVAATDSYRLGQKSLKKKGEDTSVLVPAASLQELMRSLKDDTESVVVSFDEQQARFSVGGIEIITRLVEGQYPDYMKLIPSSFTTTAIMSRKDLNEITKVSSLFAREAAGSVTLTVDGAAQEVSIRSIASQVGENTAQAAAQIEGDATITMNSRYILDALQAYEGDTIKLNINGKLDPCVLTNPEDDSYIHLIMPVKS